ncbi:hypothetical protein T4D_15599 [Trichinella pseudospiralis]|uniref:Uncharacterized protein n=1 Tax=Trichinella pseudospiralis TaxID=6337 RepID=A0A0V1FSF2_TRIPS|nr:hypothetical protein T4D_15599 [Trichinella pseudospiralis]
MDKSGAVQQDTVSDCALFNAFSVSPLRLHLSVTNKGLLIHLKFAFQKAVKPQHLFRQSGKAIGEAITYKKFMQIKRKAVIK